jgi:hypothetical protein
MRRSRNKIQPSNVNHSQTDSTQIGSDGTLDGENRPNTRSYRHRNRCNPMAVAHYGELIIHFYFLFLRCPMANERETHSPEKSNDSLQTWELWAWGNKRVGFATLEPHIKSWGLQVNSPEMGFVYRRLLQPFTSYTSYSLLFILLHHGEESTELDDYGRSREG